MVLTCAQFMSELNYPCPSCGFLIFDEPSGSYDICDICGWEDDHVQLKYPFMRGGANGGSLFDYQQEILKEIPAEIMEHNGYLRDSSWHPLRHKDFVEDKNTPNSGLSYFMAATEDAPIYYWKKEISN